MSNAQVGLCAVGQRGDGPGDGCAAVAEPLAAGALQAQRMNGGRKHDLIARLNSKQRVCGPGPWRRVAAGVGDRVIQAELSALIRFSESDCPLESKRQRKALANKGESGVPNAGWSIRHARDRRDREWERVRLRWTQCKRPPRAGTRPNRWRRPRQSSWCACAERAVQGRLQQFVTGEVNGGDLAAEVRQDGDGAVSCRNENVFFFECDYAFRVTLNPSSITRRLRSAFPRSVQPAHVFGLHQHRTQATHVAGCFLRALAGKNQDCGNCTRARCRSCAAQDAKISCASCEDCSEFRRSTFQTTISSSGGPADEGLEASAGRARSRRSSSRAAARP